jgi:mono/diheme cytochrome c family protein
MKLQSTLIIKTLIVSISVLFVLTVFISNSKNYLVSSANKPLFITRNGGKEIYTDSCARCHGADGRAETNKGKRVGATNFTSASWKPNDVKGIRIITNGKGNMPSFKDTLSAEEIKTVWNYVREFKK